VTTGSEIATDDANVLDDTVAEVPEALVKTGIRSVGKVKMIVLQEANTGNAEALREEIPRDSKGEVHAMAI
jgi:hypothetical protein